MEEVILAIHLVIAVLLIGVILLQRSEGGALGIGGGGRGFMAGRKPADPLTRITAFLAIAFFITSITLTILYKKEYSRSSIRDIEIPVSNPSDISSGSGASNNGSAVNSTESKDAEPPISGSDTDTTVPVSQ